MTKVTTIYPDGSIVETTPMGNKRAKKMYKSLARLAQQGTPNVYVLHKNPYHI